METNTKRSPTEKHTCCGCPRAAYLCSIISELRQPCCTLAGSPCPTDDPAGHAEFLELHADDETAPWNTRCVECDSPNLYFDADSGMILCRECVAFVGEGCSTSDAAVRTFGHGDIQLKPLDAAVVEALKQRARD